VFLTCPRIAVVVIPEGRKPYPGSYHIETHALLRSRLALRLAGMTKCKAGDAAAPGRHKPCFPRRALVRVEVVMSFVIIPKILWAISLIALFLSAASDLKDRIIPNELALVIAVSGLLLCLTMRPGQICLSLLAAALVFLALGVLCHYETIAGGDAKLMAAVTLLVPPGDIAELVMGIALAEGVLSCVYLGASYMVRNPCSASGDAPAGNAVSSVAEWARVESLRIASRKQAPYAIAILGGVIGYISRESLPCSSAMPCLF
jgi:prepilin peptidase CpaA